MQVLSTTYFSLPQTLATIEGTEFFLCIIQAIKKSFSAKNEK